MWVTIAEQQQRLQAVFPLSIIFPLGQVVFSCNVYGVLQLPGKVHRISSSIEGRIQLLLILAYHFENQYPTSKEHFGFKITQALNIKNRTGYF